MICTLFLSLIHLMSRFCNQQLLFTFSTKLFDTIFYLQYYCCWVLLRLQKVTWNIKLNFHVIRGRLKSIPETNFLCANRAEHVKFIFKADQSCKTKPYCSSCIIDPWTLIQQNNWSTVNSFLVVLTSPIGGLCFKLNPEMEFLDINLTKDSSLFLHAIHNTFFWWF